MNRERSSRDRTAQGATAFRCETIDAARRAGNILQLPGGEILLPEVFGFCRGVERALEMLDAAVTAGERSGRRLVLLGQIIHNPWVNRYFEQRGVRVLTVDERESLEEHLGPNDVGIIPAFGVPPQTQRRLDAIGCEVIDTSCGDVRRLWRWAGHAASDGFGVFIFGRARHDETVVTKQRLAESGGHFVIAGNLDEVETFCDLIRRRRRAANFREHFGEEATNASDLSPFERLAQVSQTTMLYDQTQQVRSMLEAAYRERFGPQDLSMRLRFQPTVCRATQARQTAAVELCRAECDLVVVVGGFGSSNTRHLFELAGQYAPAYFIESADAIRSAQELETCDFATGAPTVARGWLPEKRPLRVAVLAGASCPEIVVGQVIQRLAEYLQA
jgi:4-hydroxy-3-methylbut-2-enyl diphosphate reductase